MVTRALIEEKINDYLYKVRIPIYHKIAGTADATPSSALPIASICLIAGIYPSYNIGNVVYVDFLENNLLSPIIIGLIYNENDDQGSCDIKCDSLIVNINELLSSDITIGDVTSEDVQNLLNTSNNILQLINYLLEKSDGSSGGSTIYYDSNKSAMIVENSTLLISAG